MTNKGVYRMKHGKLEINGVYTSNRCGNFRVLNIKKDSDVEIEFTETGYKRVSKYYNLLKGQAYDPTAKIIHGVGCMGVGQYSSKKDKDAYITWYDMLKRCYSPDFKSYKSYGGKGFITCNDWLDFQNFADWFYKNKIDGNELDKDILGKGSRIYSPETCSFVPPYINSLLTRSPSKNGYALGTYKNLKDNKWGARMRDENGQRKYLGEYRTMHQAFLSYKREKELLIKSVAEREFSSGRITKKVRDALLSWKVMPY